MVVLHINRDRMTAQQIRSQQAFHGWGEGIEMNSWFSQVERKTSERKMCIFMHQVWRCFLNDIDAAKKVVFGGGGGGGF